MTSVDNPIGVRILADFNAANLAAYLTQDLSAPRVTATSAPMGVLTPEQMSAAPVADIAVVWTRPEAVSGAYAELLHLGLTDLPAVLEDVDAFADRVRVAAGRFGRVILATWLPPRLSVAFPSVAMKENLGAANVLARMNLRLAERVQSLPGVILLDASRWMDPERTPEEAKLWYAAKIPFRNEVFRRAARQVKSSVRAAIRGPRKLILVDLDDTLWGGIVGDVGWTGLRLGGHDPVGEAFVDFQRALVALSRRGILLGVVSKNEERVALEAMTEHPEMVVRPQQLSGWRINWHDKAANIVALTRHLNLGLDAVVFIDDNPAERGRVREELPEVLVPEWPTSPMLYLDALLSLDCFDMVTVTDEDRRRGELYVAEQARSDDREHATSTGDWLRRLDLQVDVEEFNDRNAPRVVQLLNKTNQMNLTTRRVDAGQLDAWLRGGPRKLWSFRVADRFGDAGLTGVASIEMNGSQAALIDFVLSCRVFGRQVEHAMLHVASEAARDAGAHELVAMFQPTSKNAPCLRFLEASGLRRETAQRFSWNLSAAFPCPPDIQLRREMESAR